MGVVWFQCCVISCFGFDFVDYLMYSVVVFGLVVWMGFAVFIVCLCLLLLGFGGCTSGTGDCGCIGGAQCLFGFLIWLVVLVFVPSTCQLLWLGC